ncbi:MAG: hypothetical protein ACRC46_03115 [Thermoguttaceae bacterium]
MLRMISLTAAVCALTASAIVAAETTPARVRAFRGEGVNAKATPMSQMSTFRTPPVPSRSQVVATPPAAPVPAESRDAGVAKAEGIKAVCAHCGKQFIYRPVVKSYFVGEGAPEPVAPPAEYEGVVEEQEFADYANMSYRDRYRARGTSKPLPFSEGPNGHLSRYAKTWNPDQMICDECLAEMRGKLAGKTMFSAAPTRPGAFGFGVLGGMRTIGNTGAEGERFYATKTFFDQAEDPPYWPRQYKVEPVYYVPNYNPATYVTPYQFPQSRHQGQSVPALQTYQR